jgi:hypothetical protein
MSLLKKRKRRFKSSPDALFRLVKQAKMQIVQFFGVMIGTFGSAVENAGNIVLHQPTQISRIAAVPKP